MRSTTFALALAIGCTGAACSNHPGDQEVGQAIPALAWEGYVNTDGAEISTQKPFGDYSSDRMGDDGRGFALVHLSEAY
jgi:hypothetical protein